MKYEKIEVIKIIVQVGAINTEAIMRSRQWPQYLVLSSSRATLDVQEFNR